MKYPAKMVDGNGVPRCSLACRCAQSHGRDDGRARIWCLDTHEWRTEYDVCYVWALSKLDETDEFEGEDALG